MSSSIPLSRRRFLNALGGTAALPLITLPGFVQAAGQSPRGSNILVLVELAGGNDGLNTVVPVTDAAYRGLRPSIGLGRDDVLRLDKDTGLHPAMRAMATLWDAGDLQIVEGVGYPNPNRSHFRSIEIWNAGMGASSTTQQGWVSSAFGQGRVPAQVDAEGLVLGGSMGPLHGPGRFSSIRDEERFAETLANLQSAPHQVRPGGGSPLDHVLGTYDSAQITGETIANRLSSAASRALQFPDSALGNQLRSAARLLEAGVSVPVLKVVQGGYDTHDNQPDEHAYLLGELSEALGAFDKAMQEIGLWDQVTIVTYSEFGRTARENGSAGTDHGTAAPVFVLGGGVRGGFGGRRVSLDRLVDGDLQYTTDYRSLYAALLQGLWDIPAGPFAVSGMEPLNLFG